MNHFISLPLKDWALHGIMSDLRVNYALSPFHRIGFEIDDPGIQTLAERYHDRALSREVAERIAAAWNLVFRLLDNFFTTKKNKHRCALGLRSRATPIF